jgi:hypothetical protein
LQVFASLATLPSVVSAKERCGVNERSKQWRGQVVQWLYDWELRRGMWPLVLLCLNALLMWKALPAGVCSVVMSV